MGRKAKPSTLEVHDGVYLKKVGGIYQCYFRLDGRQIRRSTKTGTLSDAKLTALTWFRDAQLKRANGEEIERVSFARLKRSYVDHIKGQSKADYHSQTIERHFVNFFAKFDDVSKVRSADILDYVRARRAKGSDSPAPQTVNRENTVLRQLLRYAVDRGWMKSAPNIPNESERLTRRRRRHFTWEEYRTLHRTARKRAAEFNGQPLKTRQRWQRELLYDYVLVLSNTGMRVDESKTVIWRNVDLENATILLEHAGKTRSSRRIVMRATAVKALTRLRERRSAHLSRTSAKLDQNEKVFVMEDGTEVASLKKGFDQLLQACGFKYGSVAERHALTSLRHTYATFRLTTKSGKRATVRALAKQMGTSERMIERHYGHDQIDDYRDELS
jgi:integrase